MTDDVTPHLRRILIRLTPSQLVAIIFVLAAIRPDDEGSQAAVRAAIFVTEQQLRRAA